MTHITYYTVIVGKRACIVKYAQSPAYEIKLFSGSFVSPSEASQQFKQSQQDEPEYLKEVAFERKVSFLSTHYSQDLAMLQSWLDGKGVSV